MREIKFRAWWNDTGKPVKDFNSEYIIDSCNEEVFTVEQFTGLHDKNGKEIYEGDIIHHYLGVDVVKWDVDCFIVGDWEPRGLEDFLHTCEVIGNTHEKPELLEVNK